MSILLVLLMCLLILAIHYFRTRGEEPSTGPLPQTRDLPFLALNAYDVPEEYCLHPGHTWLTSEGGENARVGIDGFVAHLLGSEMDHIEVMQPNRWVRQGQRLMTVSGAGV